MSNARKLIAAALLFMLGYLTMTVTRCDGREKRTTSSATRP